MKTIATILLSSMALSGCGKAASQSATPTANPDAELETLMRAHDQAWNAHDPRALTALFVEEGTVVTPGGKRVEGHAALLEMFSSPGPTKQTSSSARIESVQWLGSDLVLIDGRQSLSGPGVEVLGASEARLFAVARRVEGKWFFVAARPHVPRT